MFKFVRTNATPALGILADVHDSLSAALQRVEISIPNSAQAHSEMLNAEMVKVDRDAAVADKSAQYASSQLEFVVAREELHTVIVDSQGELSSVQYFTYQGVEAPGDTWWLRWATLNNYSACARLLKSAVLKLHEVSKLTVDVSAETYAALCSEGSNWNSWLASWPQMDDRSLGGSSRALLIECLAAVAGCEQRYSSDNGTPFFDVTVTDVPAVVIDDVAERLGMAGWKVAKVLDHPTPTFPAYLRLSPPKGRAALPPKQYQKPEGRKPFWRS
jgi:hypothetical protein